MGYKLLLGYLNNPSSRYKVEENQEHVFGLVQSLFNSNNTNRTFDNIQFSTNNFPLVLVNQIPKKLSNK